MKTQCATSEKNHDKNSFSSNAAASAGNNKRAGMSREFKSFLSDIEDLIAASTSMSGEELAHIKSDIRARIKTARKLIEETGGEVTQQARNAVKEANHYVHEEPWHIIGVGIVLGFVLGLLARHDK